MLVESSKWTSYSNWRRRSGCWWNLAHEIKRTTVNGDMISS
jgi:hypothetical protein